MRNWLNIHEVLSRHLAMEVMLLMLNGRTTSVPVVDKTSNRWRASFPSGTLEN